jgi:hypothetical protein
MSGETSESKGAFLLTIFLKHDQSKPLAFRRSACAMSIVPSSRLHGAAFARNSIRHTTSKPSPKNFTPKRGKLIYCR